jgi:flagellin
MLGVTTGLQAKSSEKLSSGYKINRAADDAAGLSISEKMRKQINGLDRASTNAQDGVSAVQTAEGALTEVHSMLQRMNELAVQASNGTNSESDRQSIQDEIDQLTTEIDRVAETTKFNETYLLKGNGKTSTLTIAAKDAGIEGSLRGTGTGTATFVMDELKSAEQITIGAKGYTIGTSIADVKTAINGAANAALLGVQILAVEDEELAEKLVAYRKKASDKVLAKNAEIEAKYNG